MPTKKSRHTPIKKRKTVSALLRRRSKLRLAVASKILPPPENLPQISPGKDLLSTLFRNTPAAKTIPISQSSPNVIFASAPKLYPNTSQLYTTPVDLNQVHDAERLTKLSRLNFQVAATVISLIMMVGYVSLIRNL